MDLYSKIKELSRIDKSIIALTLISFILRIFWLDKPNSTIFDEFFYVGRKYMGTGASQTILWFHTDPNTEHPFLAKLIMAFSIGLFGNNPWGWRIPAVLLGTTCIPLLYLLVKKLSDSKLAFLSAFILSFDTLFFIHSRIALLDIYFVFFIILGFYLLVTNHIILTPLAFSLAFLSKETALFVIPAVLLYMILTYPPNIKRGLWHCSHFLILYFAFLFGIWEVWHIFLPSGFTGIFAPIDHLKYILHYASLLQGLNEPAISSKPWEWVFPSLYLSNPEWMILMKNWQGKTISIPYYLITPGKIKFWGTGNPAIWYLTIPAIGFIFYNYLKKHDKLSLLSFLWFSFMFFPFVEMAFQHRYEYIFYFLPSIPPVSIAISQTLLSKNPPKFVVIIYLAIVVALFFINFPFRG
jgi:predicted membrane-bound dolichyl-phosphate-mannose-protein mannosyltransferase